MDPIEKLARMDFELRPKNEIMRKCLNILQRILNRSSRIRDLANLVVEYQSGLSDIKDKRYETIENELAFLKKKQEKEKHRISALIWALGLIDDMDFMKVQELYKK